jgi:hypothetical protein
MSATDFPPLRAQPLQAATLMAALLSGCVAEPARPVPPPPLVEVLLGHWRAY